MDRSTALHEAHSIFLLMLLSVPVWISWISCSLLLPPQYTRAAFGKYYGSLNSFFSKHYNYSWRR